jgi:hypothetical protein
MKTNEEHCTGSCGVVPTPARPRLVRQSPSLSFVLKIVVHVVPVYKLIMGVYPSRFSLVPITLATNPRIRRWEVEKQMEVIVSRVRAG